MFSFLITLRCINSVNCRIYALSLVSLVNGSQYSTDGLTSFRPLAGVWLSAIACQHLVWVTPPLDAYSLSTRITNWVQQLCFRLVLSHGWCTRLANTGCLCAVSVSGERWLLGENGTYMCNIVETRHKLRIFLFWSHFFFMYSIDGAKYYQILFFGNRNRNPNPKPNPKPNPNGMFEIFQFLRHPF